MNKKPKVSVVTITYNQEKYIRQALDSFVMQKTVFSFEVIIADDHSTDSTASIIREYADSYPEIIKPILREANLGPWGNFVDALKSARGEYIAICEGDDYWTDEKKLQKQVDFLDGRPEYALCFHPVKVVYEDDPRPDSTFPVREKGTRFTLKSLLKSNFIQTNSVMYRRQDYSDIAGGLLPGDWYLHLYHARFGKIGYLNEVMAAYRRHKGGIWWNALHDIEKIWERYGLQHLKFFIEVKKLYTKWPEYSPIIDAHIDDMYRAIIKTNNKNLVTAIRNFPEVSEAFIRHETIRNQRAVNDLKNHSDKQAEIIKYLKGLNTDLQTQLELYRKHPLKSAIKTKFKN